MIYNSERQKNESTNEVHGLTDLVTDTGFAPIEKIELDRDVFWSVRLKTENMEF